MDFRFSTGDEGFRTEVRDFIKREWLSDPNNLSGGGSVPDETQPQVKALRKKLAVRNWIAISWPREYGGAGASLAGRAIEIMGLYGQLDGSSPRAPLQGSAMRGYLSICKAAGGSQEIQRNIIAQRGLGLPR